MSTVHGLLFFLTALYVLIWPNEPHMTEWQTPSDRVWLLLVMAFSAVVAVGNMVADWRDRDEEQP